MANRLTKIVTRTGDDGSTGLGDGSRVSKDAPRVEVMGNLDELNCAIGSVLAEPLPEGVAAALRSVQNDLFDLGGEICRRAERSLVALGRVETVSALSIQYLNRLSDLLFLAARSINGAAGEAEVIWNPGREAEHP